MVQFRPFRCKLRNALQHTHLQSAVREGDAEEYAFQVVQILVFNNPFKIIEERNRLEAEEKERKAKIRRAKKKAHKRK